MKTKINYLNHFFLLCLLCLGTQIIYGQAVVDKLRLIYDGDRANANQVGVTVSNDGTKIAFAYDDKTISIMDARSGRITQTLKGEYGELFEIRFNQDASLLLSFDQDYQIVRHDLGSGDVQRTRISGEFAKVEFAPDNKMLIGTKEGTPLVHYYDLSTGLTLVHTFELQGKTVSALATWSDNNSVLAVTNPGTGYGNEKTYLLDLNAKSQKQQDVNLPKNVHGVRFYPERNEFVVGCNNLAKYFFVGLSLERGEIVETSRQSVPGIFKVKGEKNFIITLANFYHIDNKIIIANYDNSFFSLEEKSGKYEFEFTTLSTRKVSLFKDLAIWTIPVKPRKIYPLYDGKSFLVNYDYKNQNINQIFNADQQKFTGFIYSEGTKNVGVVARDGRMDGSSVAMSKLFWSEKKTKKRTPLETTFDQFYTPGLLGQILGGSVATVDQSRIENAVALAPDVNIVTPDSVTTASNNTVSITIRARENGDPVEKFRVFANDKLVSDETRGFKASGIEHTVTINLLPGQNVIKAVALSKGGYQSSPDQVVVNYAGQSAESNMHILAVGINEYKNPRYNLNYAKADAEAFIDHLKTNGQGIFKDIQVEYIQDAQATKPNVMTAFAKLAANAQPQDVFVFYYAGHGVMSEGMANLAPDFHLALYDITQMYGRDDILATNGISAAELRDFSKKISAQKQMIVLDACQSGGAVETFARRGAAEEKAILQLARSAGTVLLASTGSEQFATEFEQLGHGVFTYSLLEGFQGKADGSSGDKKITVKELESYLNDRIPELTQQYKGTVQYPMSWSRGQDFPVTVVK